MHADISSIQLSLRNLFWNNKYVEYAMVSDWLNHDKSILVPNSARVDREGESCQEAGQTPVSDQSRSRRQRPIEEEIHMRPTPHLRT